MVLNKLGEWKPQTFEEGKKSDELLQVCAAWKMNGSVIFASTDCGAEKYVAVWALDKNGKVGLLDEDSTSITYQEPNQFDEAWRIQLALR